MLLWNLKASPQTNCCLQAEDQERQWCKFQAESGGLRTTRANGVSSSPILKA